MSPNLMEPHLSFCSLLFVSNSNSATLYTVSQLPPDEIGGFSINLAQKL